MIKPKTLLINGKLAIPTCASMIDSHSFFHNSFEEKKNKNKNKKKQKKQ